MMAQQVDARGPDTLICSGINSVLNTVLHNPSHDCPLLHESSCALPLVVLGIPETTRNLPVPTP